MSFIYVGFVDMCVKHIPSPRDSSQAKASSAFNWYACSLLLLD